MRDGGVGDAGGEVADADGVEVDEVGYLADLLGR